MIKSKPLRVLLLYYVFLGVSSLVLSVFNIHPFKFSFFGVRTEFIPMWIPIIVGGLLALKVTLPARSFRIFTIVYTILWIIRFLLLYIGTKMGDVVIMNHSFNVEKIFYNYYRGISALDTHLPFVLYWFIHYLFTMVIKQQSNRNGAEDEQEEDTAAS